MVDGEPVKRKVAIVNTFQRQLISKPNLILVILALIGTLGSTAAGQVDVITLRDQLLDSSGDAYVEARDMALALPQPEFADLLAVLELAQPISQDRIMALILQFRRQNPELAAEFDQRLQHAFENPDMKARHGQPRYYLGWTADDPACCRRAATGTAAHYADTCRYLQTLAPAGTDNERSVPRLGELRNATATRCAE